MTQDLVIITNESINFKENSFFCDNLDSKSTPEELSRYFKTTLLGRKSKKKRLHKINLKNVKTYSNIVAYLIGIIALINTKKKYLIISISPYTFLAVLTLFFFRIKPFVYLRSDGYGEYKSILGFFGPMIYHVMFLTTSKISNLISCSKFILKNNKGSVIFPSQLSQKWLTKTKESKIEKIKLLYVGRIRVEKGIFYLIKILQNKENFIDLNIVGAEVNSKKLISQKNIKVNLIETDEDKLIQFYDECNIFVLPSYTEGHPMVILESLARLKPVIVFEEIQHVIGTKKGIFVSKRNKANFFELINYIKKNYNIIQIEMKKNKLPLKKDFIEDFVKILKK